jgi:hypothetical protein
MGIENFLLNVHGTPIQSIKLDENLTIDDLEKMIDIKYPGAKFVRITKKIGMNATRLCDINNGILNFWTNTEGIKITVEDDLQRRAFVYVQKETTGIELKEKCTFALSILPRAKMYFGSTEITCDSTISDFSNLQEGSVIKCTTKNSN